MRLIVIIASVGRRDMLARTLQQLERQVRCPDEVVLSVADLSDAPFLPDSRLAIRTIVGLKGLAAQRNTGLNQALPDADIITFFDDDFLPEDNYLARIENAFCNNPDFAVVHGNVVADGIGGAGLTFEDGLAALTAAGPLIADENATVTDDASAYGCNMSFRGRLIGDQRFDERLVLYGWQEDRDFSFRIGRKGRVVRISNIVGVHLGVKGGRVSGLRLGYSQIVNPIYLVKKGTMPVRAAANLMARNVAANTVRSLRPEPWIDRRGRLKGNVRAIRDILFGRIEPETVLQL